MTRTLVVCHTEVQVDSASFATRIVVRAPSVGPIIRANLESLSFGQIVGANADPAQALRTELPLFIYFSLATLSTLGGDITPVSMPARYAVVAEAITGQLYLAILVARLVSMQIGSAEKT